MTPDDFLLAWEQFVAKWVRARDAGEGAQRALVTDALAHGLPPADEGCPSPRTAKGERRRCEVAVIRAGGLFDRAAYLRANADARKRGVNPLEHFCRVGWQGLRNPSRRFDVWWYWSEYLDPRRETVNPLLHYLLAGRMIGLHPVQPVEHRPEIASYVDGRDPRRICLFAGYDPDGVVDDYVVDYLRELSRHADVYYLADGYVEPEELAKLAEVTHGAWAVGHGAYDFGSYAMLARDLVGWDLIDQYDELMLANDSGFLLRPLDEVFAEMDSRPCDWWGLQATRHDFDRWSNGGRPLPMDEAKKTMIGERFMGDLDHLHISSYFLVYRGPVFRDDGFRRRLDSVTPQSKKVLVIYKYEIGLSRYLMNRGFDVSTFIPDLYAFHPLYTEQYFDLLGLGFPLLKRNFLSENSRDVPDLVKWRDRILSVVPDAPVEVVERNLARVSPDDRLRRSFALVTDETGEVAHKGPYVWREVVDEDRVAPKYDHWWAFPVDPAEHVLSGNQRALFEAVRENPAIRKLVLTRSRRIELEGPNVTVVPLTSREGQRLVMRARNVFVEQTPRVSIPYPLSPRRHNFIHVGGGARLHQPLAMTALHDDNPVQDNGRCARAVASSRVDALAASSALRPLALDQVWVTGALRNDLILGAFEDLPADLREQESRLRHQLDGRRLVLFSPAEPGPREASSVGAFAGDHLKWLMTWCERNDVVLGFQDHRTDLSRRLSRMLRPLGAVHLSPRAFPYPEVLYRVASSLVTDHAQSGVDFSVTGRPVVSFASSGSRPAPAGASLLYDLDGVLAGEVCADFEQFQDAVERMFDPVSSERLAVDQRKRAFLFERLDAHNAARLVRFVRELNLGLSSGD